MPNKSAHAEGVGHVKNPAGKLKIPRHIAIILDGNGRWATKHGLPHELGHKEGCDNLERIIRVASDLGVQYLTAYAFSTENWKRSEEEVDSLMHLFLVYMGKLLERAMDEGLVVRTIGDTSRFSGQIRAMIKDLDEKTRDNGGMTFIMAMNYGGRDEITRAVARMTQDAFSGKIAPDAITQDTISSYLDTAGIPDPDLIIRTSGELRLSNYLLWQMAYSELYFTDVLWPDFDRDDLIEAILSYTKRDRRFGGR